MCANPALPASRGKSGGRFWLLPAGLALIFTVVFSALALLKREAFTHLAQDTAVFDQLVWNTSQGRWFQSTLIGHADISLGDHFSPILLALVPLYWAWPETNLLLVVQAVALAVGVVPVYWWARERVKNPWLVAGVVLAYFLYPATAYISLFEFHEVALVTPLLGLCLLFLFRRRYGWFLLFTFLALSVKEEIAFIVIGFGLYILVGQRRWRWGMGIISLGLVWGYLTMGVILPHFNTTGGGFYYMRRYAYLGNSLGEILLTMVAKPQVVAQYLWTPDRRTFLWELLWPVGFLPLFGPRSLALALPILGYLLLGESVHMHSIRYQYAAPLIPFIFFALVEGVSWLERRLRPALVMAYLSAFGLAAYFLLYPGPLARGFNPEDYQASAFSQQAHRLLKQIPPQASVSASRNLASHLSQRQQIYFFPKLLEAEYVLVDGRGLRTGSNSQDDQSQALWTLVNHPQTTLLADGNGLLLWRRGEEPQYIPQGVLNLDFGGQVLLVGYDIRPQGTLKGGQRLDVRLYWQAQRPLAHDYTVFVHLMNAQGERVAQQDSPAWMGTFPNSAWPVGRVFPDTHTVDIPKGASPGEYHLWVGLYRWDSGERLPVNNPGSDAGPSYAILKPVTLERQ